MKKILLMSVLCLAIVACGKKEEAKQEIAETTNVTQKESTQIPNPFVEVKNLDEASKIAGFTLEVPETYEDYKKQVIQAIEDDMIEVIYYDENSEHEGLRIRKAKGTDDISGDYNEYKDVETVKVGDFEIIEKGSEGMLRSDAKWSWWRYKSSEHFFVFWEPGFGSDPNAETIPEALRVDVDDLLLKAEQFYKTNIEKLGMAMVGEGKSVLDKYKMEIFLLYQTEWFATGSGYDDMIGALWVNPSTCKPVGSTIAHEIGHSFQYQTSADQLYTRTVEPLENGIVPVGFRYGNGEKGAGGSAFWEQCAQWQSFQDYPEEAFTQDANVQVWLRNHHRNV